MISHTEFKLDIDPTTGNIKTCPTNYKSLNRDNKTFCLLLSDEGIFLISSSYNVPKLRYRHPPL